MAILGTEITTLLDEDEQYYLLPRTVLKAIADDNGNYISSAITAAHINSIPNRLPKYSAGASDWDTAPVANSTKPVTSGGVYDAINAINTRVTNIEETLMGENEVTVQYPDDSTYTSLMPNKVPLRALKFAEVPTIRGKTRAWNQLAKTLNNINWFVEVGGSVSYNDGVATISPDTQYSRLASYIPFSAGHIMLVIGRIKLSNSTNSSKCFSPVGS